MANEIINIDDLQLNESFIRERNQNVFKKYLRNFSLKEILLRRIPILKWLPEYQVKQELILDIIAGVTVAILQVPQSIAYGYLSSVAPICGIYCAFFSSVVYFIFGAARHISVGVFAVICIMTSETILNYSSLDENGDALEVAGTYSDRIGIYRNIDILVTLTFIVSLCQFLIFLLRLDIICNLLSETLINAFSTSASIHIVVTQLQDLFGLRFISYTGYFRNYHILKRMFSSLSTINYVTSAIGIISLIILVINTSMIKPWLLKKCRMPMPMEVVVVLIGIALSFSFNLEETYHVKIVKHIPKGIPIAILPRSELFLTLLPDAISIALVSYMISQSINMIFGHKGHYKIDTNQEAFAMGMMNLLGSFFTAVPTSSSLIRSHLQFNTGGVSQMAGLVNVLILLVIILWIGPIFEYLPTCILSSVVLSAVYKSVFETQKVIMFWKLSKIEGVIWVIGYLTVVIVDISIGMFTAIVLSVILIGLRTFKPDSYLLGKMGKTNTYLELGRYKEVNEIPGILIFHYKGSYNYFSKHVFSKHLFTKTKIDAEEIYMKYMEKKRKLKLNETLPPLTFETKVIIIDFSGIFNIDIYSIEDLELIQNKYLLLSIDLYLANLSGKVYEVLKNYENKKNIESLFKIFASISDAILYAQSTL